MTNSQEEDWSISAAAGDSSKAAAHSRVTARDIVARDATTGGWNGWSRVREEQLRVGGHCEVSGGVVIVTTKTCWSFVAKCAGGCGMRHVVMMLDTAASSFILFLCLAPE